LSYYTIILLDVITLIFRHFRNNKGVTLVELLAALSLFAIVMVLVSTTIFQLFKGEDQASNQIEATQLANIALQDLKSQYHNRNDKICLKQTDQNIQIEKSSNGTVSGQCIEGINPHESLSITINSLVDTNKPIKVSSTWTNKNGIGIDVVLVNEDNNQTIDDEDLNQDNCNIKIDDGRTYTVTATTINSPCTLDGSSGTFANNVSFYKNTGNNVGTITIIGDVTFLGSLTFSSTNPNVKELIIKGNVTFNDDIIFDKNHTEILVEGNAIFKGEINTNNNPQSSIEVLGDVICKNELIGSSLKIDESRSCSY
jgi:prepilin-type N-terminal cleavage/methylation domain-containing protein